MKPKLLIVCGLGRSGTTLLGALLVRSRHIDLFNETPHLSYFPGLTGLVEQYRHWAKKLQENPYEAWRGIDQNFIDQGIEQIFRGFCRAFAPTPLPANAPTRSSLGQLICLKRPEAELDAQAYESTLPELEPLYLYCIRDPVAIYSSTLSVAWGATTPPMVFLKRLEASIGRARALSSQEPSRACLINIDRASRNPSDRRAIIDRLFRRIGLEIDNKVRAFVEEWPPVNRSSQVYGGKQFLSDEEKEGRLDEFRRLLDRRPELRDTIQDMLEQGGE